ncbi:MAG TPA: hypothetical protein VFE60_24215, partial [Roseiarcus sp.]|nr:hypothetical protein [Roseiarcus sp.]
MGGPRFRCDLVIAGERGESDGDAGPIARGLRKSFAPDDQVRPFASVEALVKKIGEFSLTGALMREGEQFDHDAAGALLALPGEQPIEGSRRRGAETADPDRMSAAARQGQELL